MLCLLKKQQLSYPIESTDIQECKKNRNNARITDPTSSHQNKIRFKFILSGIFDCVSAR